MNTKPRRPAPLRRRGAAKVIAESSPTTADDAIVEHPDSDAEFGPFGSRESALADRDRYSEEAPGEGESVQEAEREIGVNDWIDAETGAPAEGQSPPHLEEP
jgi:hypothetical protein